jgi:hypothetical protein
MKRAEEATGTLEISMHNGRKIDRKNMLFTAIDTLCRSMHEDLGEGFDISSGNDALWLCLADLLSSLANELEQAKEHK